jgi:membrane protease YdiL (CAAX protease family)
MGSITRFIKRHDLVVYFVLAYTIAWGISFVVWAFNKFDAAQLQISDIMVMFLAMLLGPSLASITLTAIVDGRSGLRSLCARILHWRINIRWFAAPLLFPVVMLCVLLALSALISPLFLPSFSALGLIVGLLAGFFEEIGWTGFALPKLQLKSSPLVTGLIIGVLWGFWHGFVDYLGNISSMGTLWLAYFIFGFVGAMVATRILIVWVYNRTGSILATQLMHASSTGFLAALGISAASPFGPSGYALSFIVYAAVLWLIVGVLIVRSLKSPKRQAISGQVLQENKAAL